MPECPGVYDYNIYILYLLELAYEHTWWNSHYNQEALDGLYYALYYKSSLFDGFCLETHACLVEWIDGLYEWEYYAYEEAAAVLELGPNVLGSDVFALVDEAVGMLEEVLDYLQPFTI
jgi:hypothetical protein